MRPNSAERRSSPKSLKELWQKVRHLETAMLTTVDPEGVVHTRPMATQAIDADEFLWFFAAKDSGKIKSIQADPHVGLTYASPTDHLYVTATGVARVTDNDEKASQLWSKAAQDWYPEGPEDSGLVLIVVDVEHAEWWDGHESRSLNLT